MSRRYHYDPALFERLRSPRGHMPSQGERSIVSRDDGRYECQHCGCAWQAEDIRVYWPISLSWSRSTRSWSRWFTTHGWQIGSDGIERRVYGWTLHLGPLKVLFGRAA